MRRLLPAALALAMVCHATPARAQQDDSATALALFEQGRKLVQQGHFDVACPKLLESARLSPKVSTLLNLADCYERSGRLASAWARYKEAGAMAHQLGQAERETLARDRSTMLEARLVRMTVVAAGATPGLVIKRDGVELGAAALGTAVPVDPGPHAVEASAPGKKAWSTTVDVSATTPLVTVTVPVLADDVASPPAPPPPPVPSVTLQVPSAAGSELRTVGWIVGAAGVVGLGAGAAFGAVAMSKKSQAESAGCVGNQCPPAAGPIRDDARSDANVATGCFIAGGVLAAGGVVLWLVAPRQTDAVQVTPTAGPGTAGLTVAGTW